jgi:hypothetical protein
MSQTSLHNNDESPGGDLYTDFSAQHLNVPQMFLPDAGPAQALFAGCPPMPKTGVSCTPMFYCPDSRCPPNYSHYYDGTCYSNYPDGQPPIRPSISFR